MSFFCLLCATASADEPQIVTNSLGMKFVRIPAGEFLMGSPEDDDQADADERPQRRVRIAHAFYLGQFEVTQRQYQTVMNENPSWFSPEGGGRNLVQGQDVGDHPVENVSWDEAVLFCRKLSDAAEESGRRYRLPTEAEWEYACRAGTTTRFSWGDLAKTRRVNVLLSPDSPRKSKTEPVGSYKPNAWDLHDMHGNVWEWCSDRYAADAYQTAGINPAARSDDAVIVDPQGPAEGTGRVIRGGDYRFDARQSRSANRDFTRQSRRDLGNGFRVVLQLDAH